MFLLSVFLLSEFDCTRKNKPGTAQVGALLKFQNISFFYICKSTLLLKFHQIYSAKIYLKEYAWLKNPFFPTRDNKTSQKTKNWGIFFMKSPVSRLVPKTLRKRRSWKKSGYSVLRNFETEIVKISPCRKLGGFGLFENPIWCEMKETLWRQ